MGVFYTFLESDLDVSEEFEPTAFLTETKANQIFNIFHIESLTLSYIVTGSSLSLY